MRYASLLSLTVALGGSGLPAAAPPNVILIMTDDQGYGDLGVHGNPVLRTPNVDRLAGQSARVEQFYVCPVCSPTRSSLLTGRYNYRTGVLDTYIGRSMMYPDEVTLAELLRPAGYRTGIFGKWHLGDSYPLRPIDQGFDEALVHKGGGIGQPSDPPGGESYFNTILQHNGKPVKTKGYCTDVFFDAALQFIEQQRRERFFVYLTPNCPHTPLEVPEEFLRRYRGADFDPSRFPKSGNPLPKPNAQLKDTTARVYAMVENIDENIGRLLDKLDALGLAENTIVIFLTDNGPQQPRYVAGLRGRKGSVYEGGIRVPFYIRWPARLRAGHSVRQVAAHIDVVPTLLEAAGVKTPAKLQLDGRSILPLLEGRDVNWPERTLFFQWHRGDIVEPFRNSAVRAGKYKLVQAIGADGTAAGFRFELFDIASDPFEMHDLADQHPQLVGRLKAEYRDWHRAVTGERQFQPPRIVIGAPEEDPVILTRQDWRGELASWAPDGLGHWAVDVTAEGPYDVLVRLQKPFDSATNVELLAGKIVAASKVPAGTKEHTFTKITLPRGPVELSVRVGTAPKVFGPYHVEVRRR